jgi:hypothetical protein
MMRGRPPLESSGSLLLRWMLPIALQLRLVLCFWIMCWTRRTWALFIFFQWVWAFPIVVRFNAKVPRCLTCYHRSTMCFIVVRCIMISFQNCAYLLEIYVLELWYDAFHRSTTASAYFFIFWAFFDDFLTLACLMSDFSPLGHFAWFGLISY